ncbi:Charged multivesicular body protein 6-like [Homarus americanus]|uniref:Charged multivesicular body protein 6-like n=2 Tax=Homarus americanus TaxID=6706 RepID=A0A8J5N814_HOMAM|nr:Charged multivesicular body protein 6-like [Homarus americanus]
MGPSLLHCTFVPNDLHPVLPVPVCCLCGLDETLIRGSSHACLSMAQPYPTMTGQCVAVPLFKNITVQYQPSQVFVPTSGTGHSCLPPQPPPPTDDSGVGVRNCMLKTKAQTCCNLLRSLRPLHTITRVSARKSLTRNCPYQLRSRLVVPQQQESRTVRRRPRRLTKRVNRVVTPHPYQKRRKENVERLQCQLLQLPVPTLTTPQDVMTYLLGVEKRHVRTRNYLVSHPSVNQRTRAILVDWLIQVQSYLDVAQETLYQCVALVDRVLEVRCVPVHRVQLLAITCLLIVSKLEEKKPLESSELLQLTLNSYTHEELLSFERQVLKVVQFQLTYADPSLFLNYFLFLTCNLHDHLGAENKYSSRSRYQALAQHPSLSSENLLIVIDQVRTRLIELRGENTIIVKDKKLTDTTNAPNHTQTRAIDKINSEIQLDGESGHQSGIKCVGHFVSDDEEEHGECSTRHPRDEKVEESEDSDSQTLFLPELSAEFWPPLVHGGQYLSLFAARSLTTDSVSVSSTYTCLTLSVSVNSFVLQFLITKMGHLFSKKPQSKVTEHDKAVLQLKSTRDKIRQYQKRSEGTVEKDRQLAKKLLRDGRKERAKLLLRKKRFIEEQLKKTDGTLENIERMIQDIEFSQIELQVVDSLKVGNESLKQINEMLSVEDVERILDETQEAVEKQQEIDALLSGGLLTEEDETAVEEELDAIIAEAVQKQLPEAPTAVENPEVLLPDVPETLPEPEKEKEKPRERVALSAS